MLVSRSHTDVAAPTQLAARRYRTEECACPSARPSPRRARSAGLTVEQVQRRTRIRRTLVHGDRARRLRAPAAATSTPAGTSAPSPATVGVDPAPLLAEFDAATSREAAPPGPPTSSRPRRPPARSAAAPTGPPRWPPPSCWCSVFGVAQVVTGDSDRRHRGPRRRRPRHDPSSSPSPSPSPSTDPDQRRRARSRRRRATKVTVVAARQRTSAGSRRRRPAARSSSRALLDEGRPGPSPTASGSSSSSATPARSRSPSTARDRLARALRQVARRAVHARGPGRRLTPGLPRRGGRRGALRDGRGRRRADRLSRHVLRLAGASRWSRSAAPATRSTPRSSPAGSPPTAGTWSPTRRTPTSCSSTPAASSRPRRRTPSTRCSRPPTSSPAAARRRSSPSAAWPSATAHELAEALPEADAVLGFDDYADISRAAADGPRRRGARRPRAARPPHAAARLRRSTGRRRLAAAGTARPARAGVAPRRPASTLRRPAGRAAQARLRLRPALLVLRDPGLPRLVRLAPALATCSPRRAGWPSRACASSSWSARTPRPTARTSATCGCWRRCCPSWPRSTGIERVRVSYLQPAEMRPGLVDVIAATPGVAPYFDLSFQHASAPVLRRMRRFGDTERFLDLLDADPRGGAGRGRPLQLHRRLPRRDRGRRRRARAVPHRRPARRDRRLRLLRRGRHRGRRPSTASTTEHVVASGSSASPRLAEELMPSARRSGSARRVEVLVEQVSADVAAERRGPGRAPGARGRRVHDRPRSAGARCGSSAGSSRRRVDRLGRRRPGRAGRRAGCAGWRAARDAGRTGGERLEHRQRPDRAAARARPGLPARCCFQDGGDSDGLAGRRVRRRSRSPRSPTGSTASWPGGTAWSPTSARSPTRSPTRR